MHCPIRHPVVSWGIPFTRIATSQLLAMNDGHIPTQIRHAHSAISSSNDTIPRSLARLPLLLRRMM